MPQGGDDKETIRRVLQGDVDSFGDLVSRYERRVFSIVGKRIPQQYVQEVAQDVFVAVYKSLAGYRGDRPFEHWLTKIALHRCVDFWRTRARVREIPESALSEEHREWVSAVIAEASYREYRDKATEGRARELLWRALAQLSPQDRMIMTLVHFEGYSVQEAASALGLSVVNVKVRAFRARRKLKAVLLKMLENE